MVKHRAYSAGFKLKVVDHAEKNGKHSAAKIFGIDRKRVREWCKNKNQLREISNKAKRLAGGGRKVRHQDIEEKLITWFNERRQAGVRVTGKALRYEALRLHKQGGNQSFKASSGWFASFKKRHNITMRRSTHVSQHDKAVTDDRIGKFLKYAIRLRKMHGYNDAEIGNMDETPVWLEMPGKSTLHHSGEKDVTMSSTGHEKKRITVTLGAFADGSKISPLVLLPGVRPPKKEEIPTGIIVYMCGSGKKSWADEVSVKYWLRALWGRNNSKRRMLVSDSFKGHLTPEIKEQVRTTYNTDMCVIPGGCTSKLQPADVSWNRPFKSKISELYDEWLFGGPIEMTSYGNRKAPSKKLILEWIKESWAAITPEIIRKSFKKCGITNALDGTEDELFNQIDDDDDPFDGFDANDIEAEEEIYQSVASAAPVTLEESSSEDNSDDSEMGSDEYDAYDSPGLYLTAALVSSAFIQPILI